MSFLINKKDYVKFLFRKSILSTPRGLPQKEGGAVLSPSAVAVGERGSSGWRLTAGTLPHSSAHLPEMKSERGRGSKSELPAYSFTTWSWSQSQASTWSNPRS